MSTNFQVSFAATPSFMQQHPLYQYCTVKQITPLGPNRFGIFFSSWQDGLNFAAECAQRGIVSNTFPGKHKTVQSSPDGRSFVALLDYEIDSFVRNPRQSWVIATHVPDFIPSAQTLHPQQLFSPPRHQPALKFTASKASFIPSSVQQTPHPIKSFASIAASSSAPPSIQAQAATSIKTAQSSVEKKGEISRGTIFYEKNGKKLFIVSNDYPTSGELPFEKFKAIFDSGWDCHHVVKGLLEGGRVKKINTTRAIDDDVTKFCSKLLYAMGLKPHFP